MAPDKRLRATRQKIDFERIRSIILVEEDKPLELKEVFARVLEYYNKSVNYR